MRRSLAAIGTVALLGLAACAPAGDAAAPSPAPIATAAPSTAPSVEPSATASPDPPTAAERAAETVAAMSTREKAASVVMGYAAGTDPQSLKAAVARGSGGLILMGDNVPSAPDALTEITTAIAEAADPPPLVAIDQEGGDVARIAWDGAASARDLKGADSVQIAAAFAERGTLLAEAGIPVNFGIVADLPRSADSFIFSRAYGTDPQAVAQAVEAAVAGESGRAFSTLKHFPGHGAADGDSHSMIPSADLTLDEWRELDAVPFAAGVDAGAELVMMGHLRFGQIDELPASLSPEWYRILREDLGFDGVAVTDDLGMLLSSGEDAYTDPESNAVQSLAAGADLVLTVVGSTPETADRTAEAVAAATEDGSLSADRLEEAATRVMALRFEAAAPADPGQ